MTIKKKLLPIFMCFTMLFSLFSPIAPVAARQIEKEIDLSKHKNTEVFKNIELEFPKKQKERVELLDKRTENRQEFLNPDGTITVETFSKPVFWKDKSGKWNKIKTDIIPKEKNGFSFENHSNKFKLKFKNEEWDGSLSKIEFGDKSVEFAPVNPKKVTLVTNKNKIQYKNIYPNVDFEYYSLADGLKEDIVLKNNNAQNSFTFEVKSNNLTPVLENNTLNFYNKEEVIFNVPQPYAVDSNGLSTNKVDYELNSKNEKYFLTITLDEKWLKQKEIKFPVIIDPTILFVAKPGNTIDTYIMEADPDSTHYSKNWVEIGKVGSGDNYAYFDFNLPSLYSGAEITYAEFQLYQYAEDSTNNTIVDVHRITNYWSDTKTTWNNSPAYDSALIDSETSNFVGLWGFNVTNTVKEWYNGDYPNYGFAVKTRDPGMNHRVFHTSEHTDSTRLPMLAITYKVNPIGSESFWRYDNGVNTHNGNFLTGSTDFVLNGRGVPIALSRNYNSLSNSGESVLGIGWQFAHEMRLKYNDPHNTKALTFIDEDGTKHFFTYDGTKWVAPKGIFLDLTYDSVSEKFSVTDKSQTKYLFNTSGKLESITDTNGNVTTMAYATDGKVTTITDASGRTATFVYHSPYLIEVVNSQSNFSLYYEFNGNVVFNGSMPLWKVRKVSKKDGSILVETIYSYDTNGKLNTITDFAGNDTKITYDSNGRVSNFTQYETDNGVTNELITSYSYQSANNGNILTKTNPKGTVSRLHTNDNGNLIKEEYNYNSGTAETSISYSWNEKHQITEVTDANGYKTTYSYDGNGNTEEVLNSKNHKTLMKFDNQNNLTQYTGFAGETTKKYYDSKNNNTTSISPLSSASLNSHDAYGNVLKSSQEVSLGNNLVLNSGFETWGVKDNQTQITPTHWHDEGYGDFYEEKTNIKSGTTSLKLTSPSSSDKPNLISNYINVNPNTKYNLSWEIKTDDAQSADVKVLWYSGYDIQMETQKSENEKASSKNTYGKWIRNNQQFEAPLGAKYARVSVSVDTGVAYFDDVQFQESALIREYNTVTNAGFENEQNGDGNPDNWYTTSGVSLDTTQDNTLINETDKNSILIQGNPETNEFAQQNIAMPGKKGDEITISGFTKTQNISSTGGNIILMLRLDYEENGETKYKWYSKAFNKTDHGWEYLQHSIVTPVDYKGYAAFAHVSQQTGNIWFDDVMVRQTITNNAMVSEYNLLQNSSFEKDTYGPIDFWEIYKQNGTTAIVTRTSDENDAYIGKHAMKVSDSTGWVVVVHNQFTPLKSGKTYTFSAMSRTENDTSGGGYLKLRVYDTNGAQLHTVSSEKIANQKDWDRFFVQLKADDILSSFPEAVNLKAFFEVESGTDGSVYFDSARLEDRNIFSEYTYNTEGNYLESELDEKADLTDYHLDDLGNVLQIDYPNGTSFAKFNYDELNRLINAEDSSGLFTQYHYGNLTGNIDKISYYDKSGTNNTLLYENSKTYNDFGEVKTSTDASGYTTQYKRDVLGNVTDVIYPNENAIHYEYTPLNQVKSVSYNGQTTPTWQYEYDKKGNLVKTIKNGMDNYSNQYDVQTNELTKVTYPSGTTTSFGYNPSGKLTVVNHSSLSGATSYEYYESGAPFRTIGPNGETSVITTDESGRLSKINTKITDSDDGFNTYFNYSDVGMLGSMYLMRGNGELLNHDSFEFDLSGNITSIIHKDGSKVKYTYDSINQLKEERYYDSNNTLISSKTYTYDVLGNRKSLSEFVGSTGQTTTTNYGYISADKNLLTSKNGIDYIYDENGNTLSDEKHKYSYSPSGNLIKVTDLSGNLIAEYDYDEQGKRIQKTLSDGATEKYYYEGEQLAFITNGLDEVKYSFARNQLGQLLSFTDHTGIAKTYFYELNYRGDVTGLYDGSTKVVSYKYDSFGKMSVEPSTTTLGNGILLSEANPFRYASYFYDSETSHYYVLARNYNPENGRFLTRDSVPSENLYVYNSNNPVVFIDYDGNFPIIPIIIVGIKVFNAVSDAIAIHNAYQNGGLKSAAKEAVFSFVNPIPKPVANGLKTGIKALNNAKKTTKNTPLKTDLQFFASKKKKPMQIHHYATNKSKRYTPLIEKITKKYDLDLDDNWNKESLPHQGRHPYAYHDYVLTNMKTYDSIANGDKEKFLTLFENLKQEVRQNPDMLYKDYWRLK